MKLAGVSLQLISLGAMMSGWGSGRRRDDCVEMMIRVQGLRQGHCRDRLYLHRLPDADRNAGAIAGFVPVGFAASSAGEYTFTLFAVVGIALIASWVVAVLFTPLTGVFILPDKMKGHGHEPSRFACAFHTLLDRVLHLKYWVIGATVGLFVAALLGMQPAAAVLPGSTAPNCLSTSRPARSSINATRKVVDGSRAS
jgi:hypothetical protein